MQKYIKKTSQLIVLKRELNILSSHTYPSKPGFFPCGIQKKIFNVECLNWEGGGVDSR